MPIFGGSMVVVGEGCGLEEDFDTGYWVFGGFEGFVGDDFVDFEFADFEHFVGSDTVFVSSGLH